MFLNKEGVYTHQPTRGHFSGVIMELYPGPEGSLSDMIAGGGSVEESFVPLLLWSTLATDGALGHYSQPNSAGWQCYSSPYQAVYSGLTLYVSGITEDLGSVPGPLVTATPSSL
jgi:hypothetical protein